MTYECRHSEEADVLLQNIHSLDARRCITTPGPVYLGEIAVTHCKVVWWASEPICMDRENLASRRIRFPNCPARSVYIYSPRYSGRKVQCTWTKCKGNVSLLPRLYFTFAFCITCILNPLPQCKQTHTICQNHNNAIICQLLPDLRLNGPSSGNAELHVTTV